MIQEQNKIREFTDLKAWQEGHELVIIVYQMTKNFPREEIYSLVDQMRRAATSITSNIAEGFTRRGKNDKVNFYNIAVSSLTEVQNQFILSKDFSGDNLIALCSIAILNVKFASVSAFFISRKTKVKFIVIPAVFVLITTLAALIYLVFRDGGYLASNNISLVIISLLMFVLGVFVAFEGFITLKKIRR